MLWWLLHTLRDLGWWLCSNMTLRYILNTTYLMLNCIKHQILKTNIIRDPTQELLQTKVPISYSEGHSLVSHWASTEANIGGSHSRQASSAQNWGNASWHRHWTSSPAHGSLHKTYSIAAQSFKVRYKEKSKLRDWILNIISFQKMTARNDPDYCPNPAPPG